jgi:hypothetical protein
MLCFVGGIGILNSGLHTCYTGTSLLEPCLQPFCFGYFGDTVLLFAQASLDLDPLILTSFLPSLG